MTKPRNTSNLTQADALMFLATAMCGGSPVEDQERAGQAEAVSGESLPANVRGREQWEALGFDFGEPFSDDPLWCPVTMPPGWSKRRTDHSMWNDIVDAAGNKRGSFFYKAAFYDRDAFVGEPLSRYFVRRDYDRCPDYDHEAFDVVDAATDAVLFQSSVVAHSGWGHGPAYDEALAWLAENYPDHEDPAAYWPAGDEAGGA